MKTSLNLGQELIDAVKSITTPVVEKVAIDEKKIEIGSEEHMRHAVHHFHRFGSPLSVEHPDYFIHHLGSHIEPDETTHRYVVVQKHAPVIKNTVGNQKEVHFYHVTDNHKKKSSDVTHHDYLA
jgi:hypothetical protein